MPHSFAKRYARAAKRRGQGRGPRSRGGMPLTPGAEPDRPLRPLLLKARTLQAGIFDQDRLLRLHVCVFARIAGDVGGEAQKRGGVRRTTGVQVFRGKGSLRVQRVKFVLPSRKAWRIAREGLPKGRNRQHLRGMSRYCRARLHPARTRPSHRRPRGFR
jgi:hypothetical protein